METKTSGRGVRVKRIRLPERLRFLADTGVWAVPELFYQEMADAIEVERTNTTGDSDALYSFRATKVIPWTKGGGGKCRCISITPEFWSKPVVPDSPPTPRLGHVRRGPVACTDKHGTGMVAQAIKLWNSIYPG